MDAVISFFLILTVAPVAPLETSFRAVVDRVLGDTRIFSGEEVRLRCSVPDAHGSRWDHLWFKGSEKLIQTGEQLVLWRASVKESGKYYCQGVRDTAVGNIYTLQSLPVEVNVDGGWAILKVPTQSGLVGQTLMFTCRLRSKPLIHEVILYRDKVEVMKQRGLNPHFHLNNLTLEDQGMYSCRASWDTDGRTRSVLSVEASVQVLEVLTQPILEIVEHNHRQIRLICHLQYNIPAPAPPINYYFYKNNQRLGTATSENHDLVSRSPGHFSCRAKVPQLGISRWSEPKSFGQVAGPPLMPSFLQPRNPRPFAPPVSSPDPLPLTDEPAATQASLHQPTPAPGTLRPPAQSVNHTVPPSRIQPVTSSHFDMAEASGDMSEESDDMTPANVTHPQPITHSELLHK